MPRVVVAIGGNSLITDKDHQSVEDQYIAAGQTDHHIASLVRDGWDVAISHGNGPQVGFILRRSELSRHELHEVPLDACVADTQGAIGYALQQNLDNDLRLMGVDRQVATVITQVEVDPHDPGFLNPTKGIGPFFSKDEAAERRSVDGWDVAEDAGRGWRRMVASPHPVRIVEIDIVKHLMDSGIIVITVGGGGIPVVPDEHGNLRGVPAVIDKDNTSALLGNEIEADMFLISTAVEKVSLSWGTPEQRWVDHMTVDQVKDHLAEGTHFAEGSMAPKMRAVVAFLEGGGTEALITNPENIERALAGETGTRITA